VKGELGESEEKLGGFNPAIPQSHTFFHPYVAYQLEEVRLMLKLMPASHLILCARMSKFVLVVQKQLGMNKIVRTKIHTGSKFSKIFFGQLYTRWIVVVHLYCGFSLWRQMAPQQSAKFRTALFGQFRTSLRKDINANYASISTFFRCLLEDRMCLAMH